MRKATVKTASDIALIKYWGKKDERLRLPENGSVAIKLDGLDTITTVEFRPDLLQDEVEIEGQSHNAETDRVVQHLDRVRLRAGQNVYAKVVSRNTFPKGTGLSSSGSGFAALTFAAVQSLELDLTEKELSILARQGSGTACRCACGGFVEWLDGDTSDSSYAVSLHPAGYWDIRDVVAIVAEDQKPVSSTEGHQSAQSSPFFAVRQSRIKTKIAQLKSALDQKDFTQLGEIAEKEALEFHAILLTSAVPLIAWYPGTIEVMKAVQVLRAAGVPCYFTINTGFNLHILTLPEFVTVVAERLSHLSLVKKILLARVGPAPQSISEHLF